MRPPRDDHHAPRVSALPFGVIPRGLSRTAAAAYIGISASKFDMLVADGRMPKPKRIDGRVLWDVRALDDAFDAFPSEADKNPWDDV